MSATVRSSHFRSWHIIKALFGISVLVGTFLLYAPPVHAATTWNITPGSACTLTDAITANNSGATSGSCAAGDSGTGTINLAAGTYTLSADLPVSNHALSIIGAGVGGTTIDGQNQYAGLWGNSSSLSASNLTINHPGSAGGYSLIALNGTVNNVVVENSTVANGIEIAGTGASVTNSAVLNTVANGNGILVAAGGSTITLSNITSYGNGTGIFVSASASTTVNVTNATIAGNHQGPSSIPAGIVIDNYSGTTTLNLKNSIVANNTEGGSSANCGSGTYGGNPLTLPTSQGHNIVSDSSCGFVGTSNHNSTDPALGSLTASNGTFVLPITYSSPAYDAGDSTGAPGTDQRGVTRPQCDGVDIGAYETATCAPPAADPGGTTSSGASSGASSGGATKKAATGSTTPAGSTPATAAATTSTDSSGSKITSRSSAKSTNGKQTVATNAATKSSSHTVGIWVVVGVILLAAASGWFYLSKHPKLLAKLKHRVRSH